MNKSQLIDFTNKQYITDKMLEIQMEEIRLALEKKNEDIANDAVDSYTQELMEAGLL